MKALFAKISITTVFFFVTIGYVQSQCTLAGNYTNTSEFQTAIDAAVSGGCINTFLTGTAQFSGSINIPGSTTLIVSGTATLNGAGGSITSANSISIQAGGQITGIDDGDITIGGVALTGLPNTINGPNIISSSGLPIELISFEAKSSSDFVSLSWASSSELNNEKFIIERGHDGQSFSQIGEIKGAGTTLQQTNYEFTDRAPSQGKNYYRLRQVDFDGKSEVSPVRMVLVGNANTSIRVFPTVSSNEFTVQSSEGDISQIDVFDIQGRLVKSFNSDESQQASINLNEQVSGQYIIVVSSNGNQSHHRVIKK